MAASSIPTPGTAAGPCVVACEHWDCQESRAFAAAVCRWCNRTIGYEVRFYGTVKRAAHAACVEADPKERADQPNYK